MLEQPVQKANQKTASLQDDRVASNKSRMRQREPKEGREREEETKIYPHYKRRDNNLGKKNKSKEHK